MRRPMVWVLGLVVVLSGVVAHAQSAAPSTPQERKEIIELAKKLEQNPLDRSLTDDARRLFQRIIEVPDITVTLCNGAMPWIQEKYKYAPALAMVYTFAAASHVIEHPAADSGASSWAGVQAALRGYQNILKQQPDAKSRAADRALQQEKSGKLEKTVREGCGPEKKES
ncbi:MAG: hypothetical protein LAN37_11965 [Acidobacteriia bacterium]|nr:hypothetical protein [Terriglobia bacterium]